MDMNFQPQVPQADTITTRPLNHSIYLYFLPIKIVYMMTNASVYCGSKFDSPWEHF